jgi:alginate biosynthesis protein AlgX
VKHIIIKSGLLSCAAVAILAAGGTAYRFYAKPQPTSLTSGLFCPQMADVEAYKNNGVQSYATLIPGQNDWIFRTKNDFRTDWKIEDQTLKSILELQKAMRTHNAELILVISPVRGMVHSDALLAADQKKYKLDNPQQIWDNYENFINDMRVQGVNMIGLNRSEVNDQFFYKRNHHWSSAGARATAQKVAGVVKSMPQYAKIPKINFVSEAAPAKKYKSSYDRAFQKICGTRVPLEQAQNYTTAPTDATQSKQALFEDKTDPQIILLGTSNSVNKSSEANFDGFLKEYLSADVLNLAVAGAGIDTSLIAYLNSDSYKNNELKIVLWEIPGYYSLDTMNNTVFKQAIPAAYGNCEPAVASADYKNIENNSPIYASLDSNTPGPFPSDQDPRKANLKHPNDLYLRLIFDKPMKEEFSVKFHYKNGEQGETKVVKFKRSNRYPADGNFYTLFPQMPESSELNKIRVTLPAKIPTANVQMQICALPSSTKRDDESM